MGVKTGAPVGMGEMVGTELSSGSQWLSCQEALLQRASLTEPPLGCQTSLCLILVFFFFNLFLATLHMQPVSLEVNNHFLQAGRTYNFSRPQRARLKGFGIRSRPVLG